MAFDNLSSIGRDSCVLWVALLAISMSAQNLCPPKMWKSDDFIYKGKLTSCSKRITEQIPYAIREEDLLSVIVTDVNADVGKIFDTVMSLSVDSNLTTVYDACGTCRLHVTELAGATFETPAAVRLLTKTNMPQPPLVLSLVLPTATDKTVVTDALTNMMGIVGKPDDSADQLSYLYGPQLENDIQISAESISVWHSMLSTVLVVLLLYIAISKTRSRRPLCLCTLTLFSMGVVIFVGTTICRLLQIPVGPFSVLVGPMVLGIGVDAILVILCHCNLEKKDRNVWSALSKCFGSLIASIVTTCIGFTGGIVAPLPIVRNLCQEFVVSFAVCGLSQVTLFPTLIELTGLKRSPVPQKPWRHSVHLIAFFLVLIVVPFSLRGMPTIQFNWTSQLSQSTISAHAFNGIEERFGMAPSFAYVLMRNDTSADEWHLIEDNIRKCVPTAKPLSWHSFSEDLVKENAVFAATFAERGTLDYSTFFRHTAAPDGSSVIVTMMPQSNNSVAARAQTLRCLSAAGGVCAHESGMVYSYTMVKLSEITAFLAVLMCVLSIVIAFVISSSKCKAIRTILVMPLSYICVCGIMRITQIDLDMQIMVALIIAPGIIADYALHMVHNPLNSHATCMSAVTTVCSLIPFVFVEIPSMRNFAIVYISAVTCGAVWANVLIGENSSFDQK